MHITVFTPTYNRATLLSETYKSLCMQSSKNFTWIVIDDGSTDETKAKIEKWKGENFINIVYFFQANQGKHIAFNKAISLAEGELCICLDSDELLVPKAIEYITEFWLSNNKSLYAGIIASKANKNGELIGSTLPHEKKTSVYNLYNRLGVEGDKIMVFNTDIVQKYSFPKISGEKFVTEAYLYDKIDQNNVWITMDKVLCITDYYPDGYTANASKILFENPKGFAEYYKNRIGIEHTLQKQYLSTVRYINCCFIAKEKKIIKNSPKRILAIVAFPAAILFFLYKTYNIQEKRSS
ncbi:glycosyltransferase family A protein [Paenibacillus sp. FSL L8-0436]|uniref:glycosyltransferase family 2 protein n=1 Tax=Paenibacillus sp. FSL L8-0436 TaxID=2954686 RepID=UPI003158E4FC